MDYPTHLGQPPVGIGLPVSEEQPAIEAADGAPAPPPGVFPTPDILARQAERRSRPWWPDRLLHTASAVAVMLLFVLWSGNIALGDRFGSLLGEGFRPAVESCREVLLTINGALASNRPWSFLLAGIPWLVLLLANLARRTGRLWSALLLGAPALFVVMEWDVKQGWWKWSWALGSVIAAAGLAFALLERWEWQSRPVDLDEQEPVWEWPRARAVLLLLLILLGSFAVRTIWVDQVPQQFDDDAKHDMRELVEEVFQQGHHPLWYFIKVRLFKTCDEPWYMMPTAYAFKYWGIGLTSVRMITVLFGLLTVWLWYLVLAWLFDRPFALTGTFLFGFLAYHVSYSRYGHTFHMPLVVILLVSLFAFRYLWERRLVWAFLAGLSAAWAPSFHLSALAAWFLLPAIVVPGWFTHRFRWRDMFLGALVMLVGLGIGMGPFLSNIEKHGYGRTARKGIIQTPLSEDLEYLQSKDPLANLKRNLHTITWRFFMHARQPGHLFIGGDKYFPKMDQRLLLYTMLMGLSFFGAGYCAARFGEERFRYFLLLMLCVPIPSLMSDPYFKRIIGLGLVHVGFTTVALLLLARYTYRVLPGRLRWTVGAAGLVLGVWYAMATTDGILRPQYNKKDTRYHFDFAEELSDLARREVQVIGMMSVSVEDAFIIWGSDYWRDPETDHIAAFPFRRLRNWGEFLPSLATTEPRRDRRLGIFVQLQQLPRNLEDDHRKFPPVFRGYWPRAAYTVKPEYELFELDKRDIREGWGLRAAAPLVEPQPVREIPPPIVEETLAADGSVAEVNLPDSGSDTDSAEPVPVAEAAPVVVLPQMFHNRPFGSWREETFPAELAGYLVIPRGDTYSFGIEGTVPVELLIGRSKQVMFPGGAGQPNLTRVAHFEPGVYEVRVRAATPEVAPFRLWWRYSKVRKGEPVPWSALYPPGFFEEHSLRDLFRTEYYPLVVR